MHGLGGALSVLSPTPSCPCARHAGRIGLCLHGGGGAAQRAAAAHELHPHERLHGEGSRFGLSCVRRSTLRRLLWARIVGMATSLCNVPTHRCHCLHDACMAQVCDALHTVLVESVRELHDAVRYVQPATPPRDATPPHAAAGAVDDAMRDRPPSVGPGEGEPAARVEGPGNSAGPVLYSTSFLAFPFPCCSNHSVVCRLPGRGRPRQRRARRRCAARRRHAAARHAHAGRRPRRRHPAAWAGPPRDAGSAAPRAGVRRAARARDARPPAGRRRAAQPRHAQGAQTLKP